LLGNQTSAASGMPFPDDDHTRAAGKALIVGASRQTGRYRTLAELEALFRTLQIELARTAPGSHERAIVFASLDSVRRAMAARLVWAVDCPRATHDARDASEFGALMPRYEKFESISLQRRVRSEPGIG
jgi:hypothetical protein